MKAKSSKKIEKKKITRFPLFIILAFVVLICSLIAYFYLAGMFEYEKIKMDVTLGDHVGLNLNTDAVHFGNIDIKKLGELTREVVITNNADVPKKVYLFKTGKISKWISFSKTSYLIKSWQNETIAITFTIPAAETSKGNYSGNLIAISQKI